MRGLAFLLAFSAIASPALAAIFAPVEMGQASAATGSTTLVLTSTAACPVGSAIIALASEVGGTTTIAVPVDSAGSTYGAVTAATGANTLARLYKVTAAINRGLPSGGTITFTFPSSTVAKQVKAVCLRGSYVGSASPSDGVGAGATATSTTPAIAALTPTAANDIEFVFTTVVAGAADSWVESAGYTATTPVLNVNATRMAYQIVRGLSPTAYSATNGASRVWATNNAAFKAAICSLAATGTGSC